MPKHDRCVSAGMLMERWANSGVGNAYKATPMFPENLQGYVPDAEFVVPHLDLAMHVRGAGKRIVAWACRHNGRSCAVIWEDPDGGCGFTTGLPSEVLSRGVLRAMQRVGGYNFGMAGLSRHHGKRR